MIKGPHDEKKGNSKGRRLFSRGITIRIQKLRKYEKRWITSDKAPGHRDSRDEQKVQGSPQERVWVYGPVGAKVTKH